MDKRLMVATPTSKPVSKKKLPFRNYLNLAAAVGTVIKG